MEFCVNFIPFMIPIFGLGAFKIHVKIDPEIGLKTVQRGPNAKRIQRRYEKCIGLCHRLFLVKQFLSTKTSRPNQRGINQCSLPLIAGHIRSYKVI